MTTTTTTPTSQAAEDKITKEDLLKNNKSVMAQLLEANETIVKLKEDLLDRESRLMAMNESINQVLTDANITASTLYRELNKNLVIIADMVLSEVQPKLQERFTAIRTQIPREQKIKYSMMFRAGENLTPLDLNTPRSPTPTPPSNTTNKAKS